MISPDEAVLTLFAIIAPEERIIVSALTVIIYKHIIHTNSSF